MLVGFWKDFLLSLISLKDPKTHQGVPVGLPVLLMIGDTDPCGGKDSEVVAQIRSELLEAGKIPPKVGAQPLLSISCFSRPPPPRICLLPRELRCTLPFAFSRAFSRAGHLLPERSSRDLQRDKQARGIQQMRNHLAPTPPLNHPPRPLPLASTPLHVRKVTEDLLRWLDRVSHLPSSL